MPPPRSSPAVFLSYAREDSVPASRMADALRAFGIEVWFDQSELRGGDAWDQKIKKQIRECSLFIPVISRTTQDRGEGYFRREWKMGVDRTHDMAQGVPFIMPVVIDDTSESAALVPEEFMRVQWTRLAHGVPTPEFVQQVTRLLETPRKAVGGAEGGGRKTEGGSLKSENRDQRPEPSRRDETGKRSHLPLVLTAAVAVVAIGVAIFALRPKTAQVASPNAPAAVPAAAKALPPNAPPLDLASAKSIAVLPFDNLSEDKESGYFADGVHEDILTNLALIRELKVVSRTTVMQYRESKKAKSLRQIGSELGVAYILEGSVRRAGNAVRVTGQLINARTDEHVWAKAFNRDLTDIFTIQAALAQEIAGALQTALSPQAQKLIERRPTENVAAYDLFLKGRDTRNRSRSGIRAPLVEAERFFQGAVELDPSFAAAWGELAVVHGLFVFWELDHTDARLARGDAAIANAVRLAGEAPDVMRSVGTFAYYGYRDYARAIEQYLKVAQLQPNDPTVISSLGLIQRRQGRSAEALANLRKAAESDPGNVSYARNLLASYRHARRWEEARATQRRIVALLPGDLGEQADLAWLDFGANGATKPFDDFLARLPPADAASPRVTRWRQDMAELKGDLAEFRRLDALQPFLDEDGVDRWGQAVRSAASLAALGDLTGARVRLGDFPAELRARLEREPANPRLWVGLGKMEALLGNSAEAVRLARKGAEMLPESRDAFDGANLVGWMTEVLAWTGDKEAALAGIAHLMRVPCTWSVHDIRTNSWFVSLRGDPRFEAILKDPKNNEPLF